MSDFSNGWRPSANLSFAPPRDPVQRQWMLDAVNEPDAVRAARGSPVLDNRSKDYLGGRLWRETSFADADHDVFGMGRPLPPAPGPNILPETQGLAPLPPLDRQPFLHRNDDAVFAGQIGDLLVGRSTPSSPFDDALNQVGGMSPLAQLGAGFGRGRR